MGQFLRAVRAKLVTQFAEMRHIPSENLMFIKEDIIMPHEITFYELIRDKARGKSGPLFAFGADEG